MRTLRTIGEIVGGDNVSPNAGHSYAPTSGHHPGGVAGPSAGAHAFGGGGAAAGGFSWGLFAVGAAIASVLTYAAWRAFR